MYRYSGAIEAGKRGAVAALVAAVSNTAMGLPHTGELNFSFFIMNSNNFGGWLLRSNGI